jgi:hypothetical protein
MWQTFESYEKKCFCKQFPYLVPFTTKNLSERVCVCVCVCVCLHVWSLLISFCFKQKRKASTKFSKTLQFHKTRCRAVCLPVTACETKHCCYHSHHDNHSAVSTRLGEMRCGTGIYNATAYVIDGRSITLLPFIGPKKLGCHLVYNSDRVEYLYQWMGICVCNTSDTCKTERKRFIRG